MKCLVTDLKAERFWTEGHCATFYPGIERSRMLLPFCADKDEEYTLFWDEFHKKHNYQCDCWDVVDEVLKGIST